MKITPLLISMLVFLMSGVMCLFSTSEVFAQVPQTKRSEQDSFLKNIRAKKRNNDLQNKFRDKQNKSETSKIRLRVMMMDTIKFDNGKAWTVSNHFIWGNIGIGQSNFGYKQDIKSSNSNDIYDQFRLRNIIFNEISLTFGKNNALTLGGGQVSTGEVEVYFYTEDENFYSNKISGWSAFAFYSFDLGLFEFLLGYRLQEIKTKEFTSDKTISSFSEDYSVYGGQTQFGFGVKF